MKKAKQKTWKYVPEKAGKIIIDGVNPYDYTWEYTGRKAWVQDPIYKQNFSFGIFKINANGRVIKFAHGEFSMGCEGFFVVE